MRKIPIELLKAILLTPGLVLALHLTPMYLDLALYSLEMVDKIEPPLIPDGYGMSLAFLCMLDIVRCIHSIVDNEAQGVTDNKPATPSRGKKEEQNAKDVDTKDGEKEEKEVNEGMEEWKTTGDTLVL